MVNLKEKREAANKMTQEQLADACDVKRNTISMIEIGVNTPSVPLAQRLGEVLDFDWTEFFNKGE